jgi:hypothetical protein
MLKVTRDIKHAHIKIIKQRKKKSWPQRINDNQQQETTTTSQHIDCKRGSYTATPLRREEYTLVLIVSSSHEILIMVFQLRIFLSNHRWCF